MKHLLLVLSLIAATSCVARANATSDAVIAASEACLYDSGILKIAIDVVRVDGNSAILTYDIPDAGSSTLYLAYDGIQWHCLGGTGGVPSTSTYQRLTKAYSQYHIARSGSQLHDLGIGRRGKTLVKNLSPKAITLKKPRPQ